MRNKKGCILSFLLVFFIFGVSIPLFMTNHKKIKADTINDLTNTTWVFNNSIVFNISPQTFYINFTSDNYNYTRLQYFYDDEDGDMILYLDGSVVYGYGMWLYNSSKTITITGGTDVSNSTLISFLQTNATMQTPTPTGTELTHKYWASYIDINLSDNEVINDDNISYKVLLNTYTNDYNNQTLTGLAFTGKLTQINDNFSYIISINNNDPITLYKGNTSEIDNPMLLEFTLGDYMDSDLYDLMDDYGVWFDDARAYMAGTSFGSIYGFNSGVAYGEANATQYTSLVTNILNGLGNILNIQVFPNITIGLLIGLPLLLGVLAVVLKILRG